MSTEMMQDEHVDQGSKSAQHAPRAPEVPAAQSGGRAGGRSNARTALVLLSIALVFFIGVIVNRLLYN
jgi:hypothetical protein